MKAIDLRVREETLALTRALSLQRCANLMRKTLSFSKVEHWHELRIRLFIDHYNHQLQRTGSLASV
jgi:hypothetical protein